MFASGHTPFGGPFEATTVPTEAQLADYGLLINSVFYSFDDVNYGNISITGTTFDFAVAAQKVDGSGLVKGVDYYVSGVTVVPIPAAAWLFISALGLLGYLGKRQRVTA